MGASRNGFTLIEILLVIIVLGIVALVGIPRMSGAMTRASVRGARITLVNLLAKARTTATQANRVTLLKIDGDHALILMRPRQQPGFGNADTLGPVVPLGDSYGVTVTATVDSVRFDPRGMATGLGTGTTVTLSRDGTTQTVRIDGLGRVTQ